MKLIFYILLLFPGILLAQDPDDCADVTINCCDFNVTPHALTIQASNNSTNIFSYPGFILFDKNMDTIAIETVNYYGIGTYFQPHTLNIIAPINFPFEGYLELHTLFYGSYECTFPLSIADTTTVGILENQERGSISVFPNPAIDFVNVTVDEKYLEEDVTLKISDFVGREVYAELISQPEKKISISKFNPGIYFIEITDDEGRFISTEKLIIR